jgi:hypothetical protein
MTTLKDEMITWLRQLYLHPDNDESCMQYVMRAAKEQKYFEDWVAEDEDIWSKPMDNFTFDELNTFFNGIVLPEAFKWYADKVLDLQELLEQKGR